jgi:hypothetical protein
MKIKTLYTCCEQVGRRGKDYELNKTLPVNIGFLETTECYI